MSKVALFDMDNTILQGRFIEKAAVAFRFTERLYKIWSEDQEAFRTTRRIAMLFRGRSMEEIHHIADNISLVPDAVEVAMELKRRGYICGIVTDSYDCVAAVVQEKLGFDFIMANHLRVIDGYATGEVLIPDYFMRSEDPLCGHGICKSNALQHAAQEYGVDHSYIVAVGDGKNDVCMVRHAGVGVSFCSSVPELNEAADLCIVNQSFKQILDIAL